jgi:hypothetical protein
MGLSGHGDLRVLVRSLRLPGIAMGPGFFRFYRDGMLASLMVL